MRIGELREPIEILRKEQVPDGGTGIAETRSLLLRAFAQVEQVSGATFRGTAQTVEPATHRFTIRHPRIAIGTEAYVRWRGRDYRIRKVRERDSSLRFLEIEAGDETPAA
jgi:SPP1 family predicted phage head-tail adaptor